jgi:hypothetical protein
MAEVVPDRVRVGEYPPGQRDHRGDQSAGDSDLVKRIG